MQETITYALNICHEDVSDDIGSLCRKAGLSENDYKSPIKAWESDKYQDIYHVEYGNETEFPLIVEVYKSTQEVKDPITGQVKDSITDRVKDFITGLVEASGATGVYDHSNPDNANPYDLSLFLPIMVANLFKGSKVDDKDRRSLSITELGTMQSDSVVNLLMPIAKGELRVRQRNWYYRLTNYNYTPQDQCDAIDSLREIAKKNEKAKQFLENEMHLTI